MKLTRLVGTFVAGTTLAVAGFGTAAQADTADDVAIIVENLPAAVEQIPPTLQAAIDAYNATGSLDATVQSGIISSMDVVGALVMGTEQFGLLPLGYALMALGAYTAVQPYVQAIDDPSTAADLVNPDDLATLAGNAANAIDPLTENLTIAVVEGVQGNITAGTGFSAGLGTPAVIGNVFTGTADALDALLSNTEYSDLGLVYRVTLGVPALATAGYVQDAEDALAPVFEALAPVTSPLVAALGG